MLAKNLQKTLKKPSAAPGNFEKPSKNPPAAPKTLKKPSPETFLIVLAPENVTKGGAPPLVAFKSQNS